MKKRIVCLTLALMMTATQVVSVSASREDELREEQAATSAQLDATYAQIDQLYSAKQQLQDEINSLDAKSTLHRAGMMSVRPCLMANSAAGQAVNS